MSQPKSPYQIYSFLSKVRRALPDESDFTDLTSALLIPRAAMPPAELTAAVVPIFRRSSDPSLFSRFQLMANAAQNDPNYEAMLVRILESMDVLEKMAFELRDERKFSGYLLALRMDDPNASHEEVMASLDTFMNTQLDEEGRAKVKRVFLETAVAEELGLADSTLEAAYQITGSLQLYLGILSTLQLYTQQNWSWDNVVAHVYELVMAQRPYVWEELSAFLDDVRERACDFDYIGESYEQYVQHTFLDNGGQQYLDTEIDREIVQHKLGVLAMETKDAVGVPQADAGRRARDAIAQS
ncbi:hypothetical protein BC936DRAFT_143891 [Jimgerdemannia flammicorona]|uniref:Uncharacterized protein n=2 Tax=Jimgerdemannia flammicorona TaxID=994334 RepID=A0A433P7Z5_9FUNG|nr:hypothetical protein BC936DRAFT_143891 [Jimgerdemannia flammicorona]RUS13647.1 hypothetical protein BC938DRAFT_477748 [Jimgerdemannia flammicorona]